MTIYNSLTEACSSHFEVKDLPQYGLRNLALRYQNPRTKTFIICSVRIYIASVMDLHYISKHCVVKLILKPNIGVRTSLAFQEIDKRYGMYLWWGGVR